MSHLMEVQAQLNQQYNELKRNLTQEELVERITNILKTISDEIELKKQRFGE